MNLVMNAGLIAKALDGELLGADIEVEGGLSTDSRSISQGDVFIALSGERYDGHAYLQQVEAKGASLAVVQTPDQTLDIAQIKVADSLQAYGQLAGLIRQKFTGTVFGITGSSGKTSCKEMLVAILSTSGKVHATAANNNNEVGVPLTLSQISTEHDFAVIEMGAGKPDDIGYLIDFAQPNVALVTNVGEAHLELFGSRQSIAETKKQIYNSTSQLQAAVVFGDDELTAQWAVELKARDLAVLSYGLNKHNDVFASDIESDMAGSAFILNTPNEHIKVQLNVPGKHMVLNACASAAMALHAGIELSAIAAGLARYQSIGGRLSIRPLAGWSVIDDSYNANPSSMRAAIDTLALAQGRRVLVLGDMAELGPNAAELHREIGEYAKGKVDLWFSAGVMMENAAAVFGPQANHFADVASLSDQLFAQLEAGDTLLVKGSRSSRMERVIAALENHITEGVA